MAAHQSVAITQAISRFESAWARGDAPQLDEFIPDGEAENVELVAELIAVDLERRLKAGEAIRVETYLERFSRLVESPDDVVNLIVAEYRLRCRTTPGLAVDEYLARFPQYGDSLSARLSANDETQLDGPLFVTKEISQTAAKETDATAAGLLARMIELELVSEQTIARCRAALPSDAQQNDQQVIDALLQKSHVTGWQLRQLRAGQKTFVLENGRYLLLDELGKGGMGTVYRARHVGLNREVALKTIDPKKAQNSQLIGRFQREIAVCAKLQHEHIVQAFDMGQHEGIHFLVLEYVEGADLSSIVKRDGPMPSGEAAAIGLQVAAALVYAHAQGVVHRDIKPANILLSTDGVSKLLDLGLASNSSEDDPEAEAMTALTQTGMVLGTVDYMPPEQAADMSKVDGRSDIYSLGATLYCLLTGRPPFKGGDMMSKLNRLANEEPPPIGQLRPDCPRELTSIVERMLAKKPEARYQSTVDVVRALKPIAAQRIAGRHVMTRAVHTAAEADTATQPSPTVAVTPFEFAAADTIATSMLRRKKKASPLGKWLYGGAVVVPLLIGVAIWAATSGDKKEQLIDHGGIPRDDIAKVSPDLNKPPSQYRIVPRNGHIGDVQHVAWSPDGTQFATAATDGEIRVWDAMDPSNLKTRTNYRGHRVLPTGLIWFPDGKSIASVDNARELHVWNRRTGKQLYVVDEVVSGRPAIRPDGRELAFTTPEGVILWNIERKKRTRLLVKTRQQSIQYSPSGRFLALSYTDKKIPAEIEVWDLKNSQAETPRIKISVENFNGRYAPSLLNRMLFIDDNLMAVTERGVVKYFDLNTGAITRSVTISNSDQGRYGHEFSSDGRTLVVWTNDSIQLVNLKTGVSAEQPYPDIDWIPYSIDANSVTAAADRILITRVHPPGTTLLYDFRSKTSREFGWVQLAPSASFKLHGGRFLQIHTNPDSSQPLCGWDLQTGEPLYDFPGGPHLSTKPDGTLLVLFGLNRVGAEHHIESWPVSGSPLKQQQVYSSFEQIDDFLQTYGAGFVSGGAQVWMLSRDKQRIRVWDAQTGKVMRTITKKLAEENEYFHFLPDSRWWFRRRLSNDGKETEIVLESFDETSATKPVTLLMPGAFNGYSAGLSKNAARVVTADHSVPYRVFVWNTANGKKIAEITVPHEKSSLFKAYRRIQLSRSGRYLLLYDQVYDLNAKPPKLLWECPTHSAQHFKAGLLGDERHIVVRLGDRYEVWDWQKNEKRITIYLLPEQQWFAFNHKTRCWNGSDFDFRHVECLHRDAAGKEAWVAPHLYEYRAKWENDPLKAGLGAAGG